MATSQQLAAFAYAVPGPLVWNPVKTASFNAVAGNAYPVNTTSGAITVTLPASPTAGQAVQITDYAGTFNTNNCTIARNGSNINGLAQNSTMTYPRESVALVYIDATQGWISYFVSTANLFAAYIASYLIIAGGAGGGTARGGGGGAGGVLAGTSLLTPNTVYSVTVGAGGAANTNGVNSSALGLTAIGGGTGGGESPYAPSLNGSSGASGGGGAADTGTGGAGTLGQGFAGGSASIGLPNYLAGGGGGASAVGANATSSNGGNGGAGVASSITGTSVTYAGGGGGSGNSGTPGSGGTGGGGAGTVTAGATGGAGTVSTGSGGGGGSGTATRGTGGAGGSGVVIISVPTVNYTGIITGSPTVTTSGLNTIMKFTANGSYTA